MNPGWKIGNDFLGSQIVFHIVARDSQTIWILYLQPNRAGFFYLNFKTYFSRFDFGHRQTSVNERVTGGFIGQYPTPNVAISGDFVASLFPK